MDYTDLSQLRVLVTGGSGFIGSNIVEYLVKNGAKKVVVLDNLSTGYLDNIKSFMDHIEFVYGDVSDLDTCIKVCTNVDVVCHQAALGSVPRSIDMPVNSHNNNVTGAINMLWAAKLCGIKRFVYASSSSVYGDNKTLPKVEDNTGEQLSPYALTKWFDEKYANIFNKLYDMETIGLRYFNIFGPRQSPNGPYAAVIPKFMEAVSHNKQPTINGDGSFSRDFTFVDNAVQANVKALTVKADSSSSIFGTAYNIGAGGNTTILRLFEKIRDCHESKLEPIFGSIRPGDIPHSLASIEKAKNCLGYDPTVTVDQGLEKTVTWFREKNNN